MPDRLLRESIRTSESIDKLSAFEETFFYRLMVSVDDQGYIDARPKVLSKTLYPLKDVRDCQIKDTLRKLSSAGLVSFFKREDGKLFVRLTNWDRYQSTRSDTSETETETQDSLKKTTEKPRVSKLSEAMQKRFDRFWKAYPRKVGKGKAEDSFARYRPDDELTDVMIRAVEAAKQTAQWQREGGQYIPHPATWLNQRRWEDEMPQPEPVSPIRTSRGLEDWD
jgi:hypothetical protein